MKLTQEEINNLMKKQLFEAEYKQTKNQKCLRELQNTQMETKDIDFKPLDEINREVS